MTTALAPKQRCCNTVGAAVWSLLLLVAFLCCAVLLAAHRRWDVLRTHLCDRRDVGAPWLHDRGGLLQQQRPDCPSVIRFQRRDAAAAAQVILVRDQRQRTLWHAHVASQSVAGSRRDLRL